MVTEIGSISAIIERISTKSDQSINITFNVNPDNQAVVSELLKQFSLCNALFEIGIVQVVQ